MRHRNSPSGRKARKERRGEINRRRQAARRDSEFRHGMLGNASETGIALRAIDASEAPSGLKQASPAVASPPSPVGFPVSNAPRKFALRSKGTEREAGEINRRRHSRTQTSARPDLCGALRPARPLAAASRLGLCPRATRRLRRGRISPRFAPSLRKLRFLRRIFDPRPLPDNCQDGARHWCAATNARRSRFMPVAI